MRVIRRLAVAFGLASVAGLVLRLRGKGGTPPQSGGWRELDVDDPAKISS